MFDARLRPTKQRALAPLVGVSAGVPSIVLTAAGLLLGLASALAAADRRWLLALALFGANRLADGLDGDAARARSEASDGGGYADIVADTIVYAAIPLGAAVGSDLEHIWPITGFLIASFYVNTVTWTYLAALIEKQGAADANFHLGSGLDTSQPSGVRRANAVAPSVVMPVGLVEGAETMAFFAFMLAVPRWLDWAMGVMAVAVAVGAFVRFVRGQRRLRDRDLSGRPVRV